MLILYYHNIILDKMNYILFLARGKISLYTTLEVKYYFSPFLDSLMKFPPEGLCFSNTFTFFISPHRLSAVYFWPWSKNPEINN